MNVRGFIPSSGIPSPLLDQLELSYLSGLQDQRSVLAGMRQMTADGIAVLSGTNGVPTTAATAPATDAPTGANDAIVNRSPRTINNTYPAAPAKSDAPWVALIAIALIVVLLLGVAMLGWLAWNSRATPVTTQPIVTNSTNPATPGTPVVQVPVQPGTDHLDIQVINPGNLAKP